MNISCLQHVTFSANFLGQTNRRRVYIKAYKGSSYNYYYEINQWKVSCFLNLITVRVFNFLFEKFKLQSQVLFDNKQLSLV